MDSSNLGNVIQIVTLRKMVLFIIFSCFRRFF